MDDHSRFMRDSEANWRRKRQLEKEKPTKYEPPEERVEKPPPKATKQRGRVRRK